ncbi:uncharacterized protein TNCV_3557691 [Trichonephila clavipes]|uniref:Uncharacterized protein n=1 Tax=Trichonephila clavipes TaxID=2585209 RepID=A0A8X6WDV3_TRICX|nr:uncharacterized protein TNCV_3557691 [Trichonephila clavipes]
MPLNFPVEDIHLIVQLPVLLNACIKVGVITDVFHYFVPHLQRIPAEDVLGYALAHPESSVRDISKAVPTQNRRCGTYYILKPKSPSQKLGHPSEGQESTEDDENPSRPVTVSTPETVTKINQIVRADRSSNEHPDDCRGLRSRHGDTLNSRGATSPLVRLVEQEERTATGGSDVVQSGRPIFDDFFQHLWPYIGNNTANVVFQMVKRLWFIRIDQ